MKKAASLVPVIVAVVGMAGGCGHTDGRGQMVTRLRAALTSNGLRVTLVDRRSGLVGPPVVAGCDPPLIVSGRNENAGFVTLYVCADNERASSAQVPRAYPGRRFRRGAVVAVAASTGQLEGAVSRVVSSVAER